MPQGELRKLFEPGKIGRLDVKNRVVMAPTDLNYDRDGTVSDRTEAFYAERAKGGVGLIIVGGASPSANGVFTPGMLRIDHDDQIPGYRRLTSTLHRYGAKTAVQILHAGRDAMVESITPVAPSALRSRLSKRVPQALTIEGIREIIEQFGQAARRAREAGFDAVELLCSSGFLISQFMSPVTNKRDDEYGGDLDNRVRFAFEVLASVRKHAGHDFPLIVRLTADDFIPGGHHLPEARVVAERLQVAGADAIHLQVGWEEASVPTAYAVVPRGAFAYLAQGLKEVVDIPVIACNRINDPFVAERILEAGKADFISMARGLLADPYFLAKAAEGRYGEINTCVACNQGCLESIFSGQPVHCLVNPEAGRERELAILPTAAPKRVAVIGGGPAGLEAARVMSQRGHHVTLFERLPRLGGQLALAAAAGKDEFKEFIRYLSTEVAKNGVEMRLGLSASAAELQAGQYDAVVVATGSAPKRPAIPGADLPHVVFAADVLARRVETGRRVVIIGARGTAIDTALFLARKAATPPDAAMFLANWDAVDAAGALSLTRNAPRITLLRRGGRAADDIGRTVRWILNKELADHGVQILTGVEYEEINEQGVVVTKDGQRQVLEADTVVLAAGMTPRDELAAALAGKVRELHVVGDAKAVRDAMAAVYEASVAARVI